MTFSSFARAGVTAGLLAALALPAFSTHADIALARELQAKTGVLDDYRRLLPLQGGSNFRDMGGYKTGDGKIVKRGLLYRSGVMTGLTDADQQYLQQLGVDSVMDLRSKEELELYPNHWAANAGLNYVSHEYSIQDIVAAMQGEGAIPGMDSLYQQMPYTLKPQLKQYFDILIAGEAPVVVNCSAGQDRTGIASALLLTALGVPRDTVFEDYLLSSDFRRPLVERGSVDLEAAAETNAFAKMMLRYSDDKTPRAHAVPLVSDEGKPYLHYALARIEADYGSVPAYLEQELGVDAKAIDRLKQLYLN